MRLAALFIVAFGLILFGVVQYASHEQDGYDACWAKGGIQVKTVKFSNGTACISRHALIGK